MEHADYYQTSVPVSMRGERMYALVEILLSDQSNEV